MIFAFGCTSSPPDMSNDFQFFDFEAREEPYLFTVPVGTTEMSAKAWGGGGGGGSGEIANAWGGGGAFVSSTFLVTSGETLTVYVATGGKGGPHPGFGNLAGGGGGASLIMQGEDVLLVAAGGGGGGADGCSGKCGPSAGSGGAGGDRIGVTGEIAVDCGPGQPSANGGTGGTETAGVGGTGPSGAGTDGSSLLGGKSFGWQGDSYGGSHNSGGTSTAINGAGGGGGSGWFGGGGGGYRSTSCGGGGGGGSSYSAPDNTDVILVAGDGANPANTDDKNYGNNVGHGGSPGEPGVGGGVVLILANMTE